MKKTKRHPGFKSVQTKIQKQGYSPKQAGAILASKTRGASKAAKKKNPNLKKVKTGKQSKKKVAQAATQAMGM